jgi:hypothetical protein
MCAAAELPFASREELSNRELVCIAAIELSAGLLMIGSRLQEINVADSNPATSKNLLKLFVCIF